MGVAGSGCLAMAASLACALAFGVEVEYAGKDPAAEFAAKEARECLAGAVGRIVLREDPALAAQEWRLRTAADGTLVISGQDGMGLAYGVYSFLEKHAGCRWYAPDVTVIPDRTGWSIPTVDERGRPAILDRTMYVGPDSVGPGSLGWRWRLRNKETQYAAYGCGVFVGKPKDCHSFAVYAQAVKAAGKPVKGDEFCLTDPEVRHIVAERMKAYIREDRERRKGCRAREIPSVYELSQNDGGREFTCTCADCRALFRAAGSWSGPNIAFANAVAEEVGREFPDVKVRTFAYSYTERPPTNALVAADNLMIRYCRSFLFQPLTAGTDNGRILRGWDEHVKWKQVWGYWRPFSGPLFPAVKPREDIGREMRFCRDMHVCGYFAEAEDPISRSFALLQHWLFLKLAEDPDLDVMALSDEFIRAYYGAAAEPMAKYLDYLERRQKEAWAKLDPAFIRGLESGSLAVYVQRGYLDREFFETANRYLDEAQRLERRDPRAMRHIAHERRVVDHAMLDDVRSLQREGYSPDCAAAAQRILDATRDLLDYWELPEKVRKARMGQVRKELEIAKRLPAPVPPELKGRRYVEWQCDRLDRGWLGEDQLVADADSVTGFARTFPNAKHKVPYAAGVYDNQVCKQIGISLKAEDIPQDGKFHLHRLGTLDVICQTRIYYDWSWNCATWFPPFGVQTDRREVWISLKLKGPTYVKGSTDPDGICIERVFFVEPES